MKSKYDYDGVIAAFPGMDDHTYVIICKYAMSRNDRVTARSLSWAQAYSYPRMIINLNVWPKHKKGIII
jgi:hypothetical protein